MGVVQRQAIKNSLLSYFGIGLGLLAQVFLYHQELEMKGLADSLVKWAALIWPLLTLGFGAVIVRFVPYGLHDRETTSHRLFTLALRYVSIALILFVITWLLFNDDLTLWAKKYGYDLSILQTYSTQFVIIVVCLSLGALVTANLINFHRIAVPVILIAYF